MPSEEDEEDDDEDSDATMEKIVESSTKHGEKSIVSQVQKSKDKSKQPSVRVLPESKKTETKTVPLSSKSCAKPLHELSAPATDKKIQLDKKQIVETCSQISSQPALLCCDQESKPILSSTTVPANKVLAIS